MQSAGFGENQAIKVIAAGFDVTKEIYSQLISEFSEEIALKIIDAALKA
ncbi:MAG: hypothetical protein WC473_00620 [Patescibacteria group bacterium]|jgi:ABC-type sulfate transport system substrate-binding protein